MYNLFSLVYLSLANIIQVYCKTKATCQLLLSIQFNFKSFAGLELDWALNYITSARFIAQSALVKWSQLQLFKAKERRGYLQRIGLYKYSSSAAPHCLC